MPTLRSSAPAGAAPLEPIPAGCGQAVLGLILGGVASFTLVGADPFGVVAFELPQDLDHAQLVAAYERWRSSGRVILGSLAMTFVPLAVSGACGVLAHRSLPASIPAALLRLIGVASLLVLVSSAGSWMIDRALSTGQSSDIQTPLAMLAFEALCIALAAPLSSAVIRRRSRGGGRDTSEATRPRDESRT